MACNLFSILINPRGQREKGLYFISQYLSPPFPSRFALDFPRPDRVRHPLSVTSQSLRRNPNPGNNYNIFHFWDLFDLKPLFAEFVELTER